MISSGIKKGLATAAVSALAITGLGTMAGPALADSGSTQAGATDSVVLASPTGDVLSTQSDGTNKTIRLEALGGSDVDQVRFDYSLDGGTTYETAGTVTRNDDGYFGYDWQATGLNGDDLTVRATGLAANGDELGSDETDTVTVDNSADSVDITPGTSVGVFQSPYGDGGQNVILSGTTSDPTGDVETGWFDQGEFQPTGAGATSVDGAWRDIVDIDGYSYGGTNQLLLGADVPSGDSDAEGYALYTQVITKVTATADRTDVPSGESATVTVTVTDQSNQPIAGARVSNSDDTDTAFTDANGQATFDQPAGSEYYYADATDSSGYDANLGDKQSSTITVTQYQATPTTLTPTSQDGTAFDFDEYVDGDITVQTTDQKGNDFDSSGQDVTYHWVITPFDGSDPITTDDQTATDNGDGEYEVDLPQDQPSGSYALVASLGEDTLGNGSIAAKTLLTVKAGQATLAYDQTTPQQAAIGSSATVSGTLTLEDGTGLTGRTVEVYVDDSTGDDPDAGFVQADNTTDDYVDVTTGAGGAFTSTLKDGPATTPETDDIVAYTIGNPAHPENADAFDDTYVKFRAAATLPVVDVETSGDYDLPGDYEPVDIHVEDSEGDGLGNQPVTVSVDHGFLTDGTDSPDPVVGQPAGGLTSLGTSQTVRTDGNGDATVYVSIGRDAGFDDDGIVDQTVTATASGASDSGVQEWSTADENEGDGADVLNGGSVAITRASAAFQSVGVLPKAPTNESVNYDVVAKDQFGNRVQVPVQVEDGLTGDTQTVDSEFTTDGPAYTLTSDTAGNDAPVATWDAPTTTYTNTDGDTADGTKTLTSTGDTTQWYVINFSASTYTLTHDVTGTRPVGSTVIETYTAKDQFGEPINNVGVQIFRSGPDVLQNGTPVNDSETSYTNQQGQVSYVFAGAAEGTANLQGLITNSNEVDGQPDAIVGNSRATDAVVFGTVTTPVPPTPPAPTQAQIDAKLKGMSVGTKDVVKVKAPSSAAGAKATLYKKVKGKLVKVASKKLNGKGDTQFKVADTNGKAATQYVVKVKSTSTSKADTSRTNLK